MKRKGLIVIMVVLFSMFISLPVLAGEKATSTEVYDMILKAATLLETLGDEGLEAFNDPKGEFVWKDTYVFIIDCATMTIAAHPKKTRIGANLSENMDKNADPAKRKRHNLEMCEIAKNPMGGWVEYWWEKFGESKPSRKIGFCIQVPDTAYMATAGIYNETMAVSELNKELK